MEPRYKVKGYKAFSSSLECRSFKFKVGEKYHHVGEIKICQSGFHFCERLRDVFEYYEDHTDNTRICEVLADEVFSKEDKSVCRDLVIVRELSKAEIYVLANTPYGDGDGDGDGYGNGYGTKRYKRPEFIQIISTEEKAA